MEKQGSQALLYGLLVAAAGVIAWLLTRKKEAAAPSVAPVITKPAINSIYGFCVDRPSYITPWDNVVTAPSDEAMQEVLGRTPSETEKQIVIGFFKAAGVKVTDDNTKFYRNELKEWVKKVPTPHWDILTNSLRCDNGINTFRLL